MEAREMVIMSLSSIVQFLFHQRMLFPSRPQLPRRQTNPVINVTGQIGIYLRVQTNALQFYATGQLPHFTQRFHFKS